ARRGGARHDSQRAARHDAPAARAEVGRGGILRRRAPRGGGAAEAHRQPRQRPRQRAQGQGKGDPRSLMVAGGERASAAGSPPVAEAPPDTQSARYVAIITDGNRRWAEELTERNARITLFVAFNYGGRAEILDAARRFSGSSEEDFRSCLYAPEMHDPDLIIRTSGEQRLSNYLLWQSAYSELVFR